MIHPFIPASLVACIAPALAADAWLTDIDAGKKQAAAENKAVLIEFTGSDWCQPCMKLRKNVTGTKEFETYAGKNYVLVEIDLARYKKDRPELYKKTAKSTTHTIREASPASSSWILRATSPPVSAAAPTTKP